MATKKKNNKTPAPSGLSISRNGGTFTLEWKIKAKNSSDGQKIRWRTNHDVDKKGKNVWHETKTIGKKSTKASVKPTNSQLSYVTMQVQDNQDKASGAKDLKASSWVGKTFDLKKINPKCGMTLGNAWNQATVSWWHDGNDFNNVDAYWYLGATRWTRAYSEGQKAPSWTVDSKKPGQAGSHTKNESSLVAGSSKGYVREYKFQYSFKEGKSSEVTCKHVFSTPKDATVKSATLSKTGAGVLICNARWNSPTDGWHPIDNTVLQYGIAVPGPNLSCPPEISWTDRPTMIDNPNKNDDSDYFPIDAVLGDDQCLFVRVVNSHDYNKSYSKPYRATGMPTKLSSPSNLTIVGDPDFETFRLKIGVDNNSAVPDSNIAIVYKQIVGGVSSERIISIIPHGVTEQTIQFPDLDVPDEWSFGAFAFVGDYGGYLLTSDTTVKANKKYYTRAGNEERTATPITNPTGNPHTKGYYEKIGDDYFISDDTTVNENKTYYTLSAFVPYTFTLVSNPVQQYLETYYELVPNVSRDVSYTKVISGQTVTLTYNVYEIPNIKMESDKTWQDGDVPRAPSGVELFSPREGVALVTWNWAWRSADIAELSWSDHDDAWESTDQPQTYRIPNTHAAKWSIYGLETGVTWYIRVRLIKTTAAGENPGPWSDIKSLDMSSAPNVPVLNVSPLSVTHDGTFNISWEYESTDGTDQDNAILRSVTIDQTTGAIIYGDDIVTDIGTSRSIDLIPDNVEGWETGNTYGFALQVKSKSGQVSEWSEPVFVAVADPLACSITSSSFVQRVLFSLTTDTEITVGKSYHSVTGTEVSEPVADDISTYYELSNGVYKITEDPFDDTKTYYTVASNGIFSVNDVAEPTSGGLSSYYEYANNVYTKTTDVLVDTNKTYFTVTGSSETTVSSPAGYYDQATLNILREMPISLVASVTGGIDNGYNTNVSIERASSYFVDRPDETTYAGYSGETVYSNIVNDPSSISISQSDLTGYLDDGAAYILTVYAFDDLDQMAEDTILFFVNWEHQAFIPDATVVFDSDYSVMKITPIADENKYEEGDTFDIYRLSVDKPVLIVKGGTFGQTYVDPYPTIGKYGGHRVVTVTANGDFICNDEDSDMAWIDLDEEDGDIFNTDFSIINYGEGTYEILYNANLSTQWNKDFKETKYLGGHIQGDWNAGISRTSTINSVTIRDEDEDAIVAFRRLAEYPGICHIRTLDGSNYYADIQVSESIPSDDSPLNSYTFNITRVDTDGYDGIELSEWNKIISG